MWEMNRLVVKLKLEKLEDISILTTLWGILHLNPLMGPIKKIAYKRKQQQAWKLGSPYTDPGVKKTKKTKAYNLMVHILVVFERQMNEQINDPLVHLEKSLRRAFLSMKPKGWWIKLF